MKNILYFSVLFFILGYIFNSALSTKFASYSSQTQSKNKAGTTNVADKPSPPCVFADNQSFTNTNEIKSSRTYRLTGINDLNMIHSDPNTGYVNVSVCTKEPNTKVYLNVPHCLKPIISIHSKIFLAPMSPS
jgi:hypothetical protein